MSLTREQLAERRQWIGASEAPAIVNVSPYRGSLHRIYLAKIGEAPEEPQTAAMTMGHRLEPVALACLAEAERITLAPSETRRHALFDVGATPDSLVVDSCGSPVAVAEAKAPGLHAVGRWGESGDPNGVPDEVLVQVHVQMAVFRVRRAHVVALLANEPRFYAVEYDEALGTAVLTRCQEFWDKYVKARVPPPPDGSMASAALIRALFPRNRTKKYVEVGAEVAQLAVTYFDARKDREEAEEREERAKQAMQMIIGDAEGLSGPGFLATWKTEQEGRTAWAEVARALRPSPELVAAHTKPAGRVFRCKQLGKKERAA